MDENTDILLKIENLSKTYKAPGSYSWRHGEPFIAVNSVSFQMRKGETLGLIGESGCGKTTAAQMIAKIITADQGKAFLNGVSYLNLDAYDFRPMRHLIQMVFQDPQQVLNPSLKIGQILEEPLIGFKMLGSSRQRMNHIKKRLKDVGLDEDLLERYPHQLSGGQRQRIAILGALLPEPALLIADEVVSSLDLSIQAQILNLLTDLKNKHHLSLLFISHDLHVVSWIADRILVMYKGHLVEEALTEDIVTNPLHPYTQKLFAAANFDQAPVEDQPLTLRETGGCPFKDLCPHNSDLCLQEKPLLKELDRGHRVACHLFWHD